MPIEVQPEKSVAEKTKEILDSIHPNQIALTLAQSAAIMGTSVPSVRRLLKRRLLRSSGALRRKMIPRTEIDRFLRDT